MQSHLRVDGVAQLPRPHSSHAVCAIRVSRTGDECGVISAAIAHLLANPSCTSNLQSFDICLFLIAYYSSAAPGSPRILAIPHVGKEVTRICLRYGTFSKDPTLDLSYHRGGLLNLDDGSFNFGEVADD